MNKIEWTTDNYVLVNEHKILCVNNLKDGYNQGAGIKRLSELQIIIRIILWPLFKFYSGFLIDGFIERNTGTLIHKYILETTTFIEIGCGDMSLKKYLPKNIFYNALDLEISEFHIRRNINSKNINIILASATDIPADSNIASMIVSTETFEHIPEIEKAIKEIHRIAKPNAKVICSIPNNFCYKYKRKGAHKGHINNWTYEGFIKFMNLNGFELLEGYMKGFWLPLPLWFTKTSYQLPIASRLEYYNTNFFFVFNVTK